MIKNIFIRNKRKSFSLIELTIVLAVSAILISAIAPVFIKQIQIKAGEKTALEIAAIQEAARAYYLDNNAWPSDVEVLKDNGYLDNQWQVYNPWHSPYCVTNASRYFSVFTHVPSEWTGLVSRDLPSTTVNNTEVRSTIPLPGFATETMPRGTIVLWRGDSCPAGFERVTELDGKFIVSDKAYAVNAGGNLTHYHEAGNYTMPDHNHILQTQITGRKIWVVDDTGGHGFYISEYNHTHSISGASDFSINGVSSETDSRPPYATILLCERE